MIYQTTRGTIMINLNRLLKQCKASFQKQRGVGLVEVLVAIAIMGSAITALLSSMQTGSNAVIVTDKNVTARSLAQAQIEYIRSYPFTPGTSSYDIIDIPNGYGYSINLSVATPSFSTNITMPVDNLFLGAELPDTQRSMQVITVTVSRDGEEVIELSTIKGNR